MSKKLPILLAFLLVTQFSFSQNFFGYFTKRAITAQYAGSTGLYSFGISSVTKRDKLELGLLYGYLPESFGGENHSLVAKLSYNPFHLQGSGKLCWEPLQTGLFVNQNFNRYSSLVWGDKYSKGYYWWAKSTRFHFFTGTQMSYKLDTKRLDRLSIYFEANTNDLYVFSYLSNTKALSLYDIFFFGSGLKLYFR